MLENQSIIPETIFTKRQRFESIARLKDFPLYYEHKTSTDDDIYKSLPNATVSATSPPKGTWKLVHTKNGTTEKTMLQTAQKMCWSHAFDVFIQELENGTFDTLGTYRIIFLEETDSNGNALGLVCGCNSNGELVTPYVSKVDPENFWEGADDAWFEQQ